ncbi:fungal-specific transcription factor domain-containing protein [Cantharellus anzutake]|uniref:fungal-specific transcription factor domain-containing protein n=1 Tax=Cantharellus anzutake TaxID=1750568 RepID=UPI001904E401|nr:fungal-specific transcription factor domain-containing protein [Cantharellus anzutake]KAF8343058.1 fungal-specific transcription factor domain-containing protein [Cantharellus anzutake]
MASSSSRNQTTRKSSQSCARCARSHRKCDGVSPANGGVAIPCTRCLTRGSECDWEGKVDHRRRLSDRDAETLRREIRELETKVERLQAIIEKNGYPSLDYGEDLESIDEGNAASDGNYSDTSGLAVSMGGLVLENGRIQYYGKTAPFSDHPPFPPAELQLDSGLWGDWYGPHQLRPKPDNSHSGYPCANWNAFLPELITSELPRHEHDKILLDFFTFFCGWQLRVIPHLFLRDMGVATFNPSIPIYTQHYSKMLHNAILSVAFAYSGDEERQSRAFRDQFAKHAKSFLEFECQQASLATVVALAVLSSYHSGFSEQGLGFMYFGMAVRMGESLGLHVPLRTLQGGGIPNHNALERNWIFWSLFCQDKCWSLYVGRSQGLGLPPKDFEGPGEAKELSEWMDVHLCMLDDLGVGGAPSPVAVDFTFQYQVTLMQIASTILELAYVPYRELDLSRVRQLYGKMRQWEQNLPDRLRCHQNQLGIKGAMYPPHTFNLNLCFHWLLILLLRPFFKTGVMTPATQNSARALRGREAVIYDLQVTALRDCTSSACQIVKLFHRYQEIYGLRRITITAVQIAYVAGLIHLARAIGPSITQDQRGDDARNVSYCIAILEEIGSTWSSGAVTARLLNDLFDRAMNSSTERRSKQAPQTECGTPTVPTETGSRHGSQLNSVHQSSPQMHEEPWRSVESTSSSNVERSMGNEPYSGTQPNGGGPIALQTLAGLGPPRFDTLSVSNPYDMLYSYEQSPQTYSLDSVSLEVPWLPDQFPFGHSSWFISDPYHYPAQSGAPTNLGPNH